ncbi:unnamed protein product [Gongylonema pulchrum]|uniref:Ig-like domain-containing protein n=1 Tax=Gongylonema pulchrum TaxID=637853 RepID=A0A183EPN0_9BILA|nr:unnamed protein product [Gongylonema pulchrum]
MDASNITEYDRSQVRKFGTPIAEMPNFHTELRSMEVFDGQPVHLEAKFSPANDPNLKITWLFNGKPLKSSDRIRISSDFGFVTLDIFEITFQDAGNYTCQVTNEIGTMESTATIIVQRKLFPPFFLLEFEEII